MSALQKLIAARWFPTVSKPILTGLLASGIVVVLRAVGVTEVVPSEVNAAVAPVVGFLIAAIVAKPKAGAQGSKPAGPSLGSQVAKTLLDDVAQVIDENPALLKSLATEALGMVLKAEAKAPDPVVVTHVHESPAVVVPATPTAPVEATGFVR